MKYRPFDKERDLEACRRIWVECGWLEPERFEMFDNEVSAYSGLVAEMNGEAECLVLSSHGDLKHLDSTIPFGCVNAVTTSRIARKQKFASLVTAATVAKLRHEGAAVSGLGMFEQGYYNRVGFGSGAYVHQLRIDPTQLLVDYDCRVPQRFTQDDWERIHAARLRRMRWHGSVSLHTPQTTHVGMNWNGGKSFGLGYCDGPEGEISHMFWCGTDNMSRGPYNIGFMVYQTREQFLELLAVMKTWSDQVRSIIISEPSNIQLLDFVRKPFANFEVRQGDHRLSLESFAWWQMRINDLAACLALTHLPCEALRFNLELTDPIEDHLDASESWRGESGDWVITLGSESEAKRGFDPALLTLRASINSFTRLWLGVRPASGLAVSDDIVGSPELLAALDKTLHLPSPVPGWAF